MGDKGISSEIQEKTACGSVSHYNLMYQEGQHRKQSWSTSLYPAEGHQLVIMSTDSNRFPVKMFSKQESGSYCIHFFFFGYDTAGLQQSKTALALHGFIVLHDLTHLISLSPRHRSPQERRARSRVQGAPPPRCHLPGMPGPPPFLCLTKTPCRSSHGPPLSDDEDDAEEDEEDEDPEEIAA